MVESRILLNNYEENVKKLFEDKNKLKKISQHISKYIDRYSEQLYYMAPTKHIQFNLSGIDGNIIMDSLNIDRREMKRTLGSIKSIRLWTDVLKEPVSTSITLILREATIRGDKKLVDQLMMYLIFSYYWSLQYRQFRYEPNESLVNYTINNLNNKYLFKTKDTVFEALYATAEVNHETLSSRLISEDDSEILAYNMSIRTRVSSLLVRFTAEVEKNRASGKYLNTVADNTDEDNYFEVENISGNISKLANDSLIKFAQGSIDRKILRIAAKFGGIPESRFHEILIGISNDEPERVSQIIRAILVNYINGGGSYKDIGSKKFISESLKILSKSNTKDPSIIKLKENLSYFLEKYSDTYSRTNRQATKNSYRRALLAYFVLHVSKVANN